MNADALPVNAAPPRSVVRASLRQRLQEGRKPGAAEYGRPSLAGRPSSLVPSPFEAGSPRKHDRSSRRRELRSALHSRNSFGTFDWQGDLEEEARFFSDSLSTAAPVASGATPRSSFGSSDADGSFQGATPCITVDVAAVENGGPVTSLATTASKAGVLTAPAIAAASGTASRATSAAETFYSEAQDLPTDLPTFQWKHAQRRRSSVRRCSEMSTCSVTTTATGATEYWVDETISEEQHELAEKFSQQAQSRRRVEEPAGSYIGGFFDWYWMGTGCCAQRSGHGGGYEDVLPADMPLMTALRASCCQAFSRTTRPETEEALMEIWNTAFPAAPLPDVAGDALWQEKLGFPTEAACTEETGRFGLLQLQHLAAVQPSLFKRMSQQAKDLRYPFVSSCCSLTRMLLVFFKLLDGYGPLGAGVAPATSWKHNNFTTLCRRCGEGGGVQVLHALYCVLVERMHEAWVTVWAGSTSRGYVEQMPRVLRAAYDANASFWEKKRYKLEDVQEILSLELP